MANETGISWCDSTLNPWLGCTKVGPGCDSCYAEAWGKRTGMVQWGTGAPRRRTSETTWRQPVKWNADHAAFFAEHGRRRRVFCASLADVFDNEVNPDWRADLFELIDATPNLDWLLLTKRIGNVQRMLDAMVNKHMPANVWLGATIVNQAEADRDIPKLLAIPAAVRFLSMEPLLGPVDVSGFMWPVHGWWMGPHRSYAEAKAAGAECGLKRQALVMAGCPFVDWVIGGGESGPKARAWHPSWALGLRDQCAAAGVPFHWKQHGEWLPTAFATHEQASLECKDVDWVTPEGRVAPEAPGADVDFFTAEQVAKIGKHHSGRLLEGVLHDAFPEVSRG